MNEVSWSESIARAGTLLVSVLALTLATLPAAQAQGEARQLAGAWCQSTAEMERVLQRRFGATRQGSGLRGPDEVMELWHDTAGDWALVSRHAGGRSCIVATGAHWDPGARPRR